jgi:hypothetical protein
VAQRLPPRGVQSGDELVDWHSHLGARCAAARQRGVGERDKRLPGAADVGKQPDRIKIGAQRHITRCRTPSATRASSRSRSHGVSGL